MSENGKGQRYARWINPRNALITSVILALIALLVFAVINMWREKQIETAREQAFVATAEEAGWTIVAGSVDGVHSFDSVWEANVWAGHCQLTVRAAETEPQLARIELSWLTPPTAPFVTVYTADVVEQNSRVLKLEHCYANSRA